MGTAKKMSQSKQSKKSKKSKPSPGPKKAPGTTKPSKANKPKRAKRAKPPTRAQRAETAKKAKRDQKAKREQAAQGVAGASGVPGAPGAQGANKGPRKATTQLGVSRFFVASAPGVEPLLAAELTRLVGAPVETVPGGVYFDGDVGALYRVALGSGLGTHLTLRLGSFSARRFEGLVREAAKLPWAKALGKGVRFEVKARCRKSRLHHSGAVAERVTTAITTARGSGKKGQPVIPIQCRVFHDEVTLSVDLTGEPLFKRGYRSETAKAPLREDLALALVVSSGWDPATPLVDPFCGSGTILIEAARHALGMLPGAGRSFAFESLPFFSSEAFGVERASLEAAAQAQRPATAPVIRGADRDPGAAEAALHNAARGGVEGVVAIEQSSVSATRVFDALGTGDAGRGAVVTNPPHGRRVGDPRTLKRLYQSLGQRIGELPPGCPVALLVRDPRTARSVGVPLETQLLTDQGGSKVRFLLGVTGDSKGGSKDGAKDGSKRRSKRPSKRRSKDGAKGRTKDSAKGGPPDSAAEDYFGG